MGILTIVLDGWLLNPGDLSWDRLHSLSAVEIYDRTAPHEVLPRARGAQVLLTNKTPLPGEVLRQLPGLRYIGVTATGYDIVDVDTARELGITVTNVPTYGTASVAQFTFALLLELAHHVALHHDAVQRGEWTRSPDWSFCQTPQIELADKIMGIVGFGRIGQHVARIASAFDMNVLASDPYAAEAPATLDEVFATADVVTLHCPLTPETTGLVNAARLRRMKRTAFLINAARGPLVVEQDLADALNAGTIVGAALDVLSVEPPAASNPLFSARNCILTPHIAWATREARARLLDAAVANLESFLKGSPVNVVA